MSRNTKKIIYKIVKDRLIVQYVRDGIIYATEDHWVFQSRTLIEDSEKSTTPFGDHSTYGRYTELDNAVLLLIHTNSTSIVHRIQEMVSMPNLFLENLRSAKGYDSGQSIKEYEVRVHTPVIPLYVIVEGQSRKEIEYMWFPDYVLLFPNYNRIRILNRLRSRKTKQFLLDRHHHFLNNGIYRTVRLRNSEIMTVSVKPWLERTCSDVEKSIEQFSEFYALDRISRALHQGLLTKF